MALCTAECEHTPLREGEQRFRDLIWRVLVPPFQARQATDTHDDDPVSVHEGDRRRLVRDLALDAILSRHHLDCCQVRRVEAVHEAATLAFFVDDANCHLWVDLLLDDDTVVRKHRRRDPEAEVGLHCLSLRQEKSR